jgi:hypothetical protein
MKRIQLISMLMLFCFAALAQSPSLDFRFNNMEVLTEGSTQFFQFDVEVRASEAGTYHRDMQIYFDYNPEVFGYSVKLNNKITVEKIGVMSGEIAPGTPKYKWVGEGTGDGYGTDNTPTRYYITSEPSLISAPSLSFHNLMPVDWTGYMRVKIEILAPGLAGIKFIDKLGEVDMMDGGQYYFDPATGSPVVYDYPYGYINNLLDYMVGEEPVITQVPFTTNFGVDDNWDLITAAGTYGEKAYEEGGWYFHSTNAVRGGTDEGYGGSLFSFRERGIFTITNLGDFENPMTGFSFQLRDWMLTTGVNRPIEFSFDGGTTWETAFVINKAWFAAYQVYQEFVYYFPGGANDLEAGKFLIRISGGDATNNSRINIGQFKALSNTPVYYNLTLNVSPEGAGAVTGGGSYYAGQSVPVTATANDCYQFINWTMGAETVKAIPNFTYLMPAADVNLTANYQMLSYTITASAGTGGSISPMGEVIVNCGANQTFNISPAAGYIIQDVLVDGASVGAVSTYTFENVRAPHTIQASFALIPTYTLTLAVNPEGAGTVTGGGTFEAGIMVPVTATANACYSFVNWTDGAQVVSILPNFNYLMPAENITLTANFLINTFTITATAGTGGSISPSGAVTVNCGANQAFTITADPGYAIADVLVDGTSIGATSGHTFENVTANHTIHATFALLPPDTYNLTLIPNPMGGGMVTGGGTHEAGASVPLTATANACYAFVNWTKGAEVVSEVPNFNYVMPEQDVTLTANFQLLTYTITASAGTGGSIAPMGEVIIICNEYEYFAITPDPGYVIEDVLVDGESVGAVSNYTFENVTTNHTIHATFALLPPDTYTLTLAVNPMGAGTVTGGGSYEAGAEVPLTATANACYSFVNWTKGAEVVSEVANFNYVMPEQDVTLTANFQLLTYIITASAGTGGSIAPVGAVTVNCGANQAFTITADPGYAIADVLVDGVGIGATSGHTFENVTANHTIHATFALLPPDTYTLTLAVNPMGAGAVTGGGSYEAGAEVPLTATANACYSFVNWTKGAEVMSTAANFNYVMPAENVTLTANFQLLTYTITASAGTGGTITPSGAFTVNCGANQTFIISANEGYGIQDVLVDGSSVGAVTNYTFENVTANHTIHATFTELPPVIYDLTINVTGNGYVEVGGVLYTVTQSFEAGTTVSLEAFADMGWEFVGWSGDLVSTANPANLLMNGHKTVSATFIEEVLMYTLALEVDPMGAGSVSGAGEYAAGTMVNIYAWPNMGYHFLNWTLGGEVISTMQSYAYLMPEMDVTLVAHFGEITDEVYCAYSQGYWFAKPDVVWPYDVVVGGWTFTKEQGKKLFWPANTNTKRAFTQYAAIYLSGTTVSLFPELQANMMLIEDYFANDYPALASKLVNRAAGFIGDWIDQNQCNENYQGIATIDLGSRDFEEFENNGKINAKAYPNPFKKETTIEFMIQDNTHLTLEVFNMVGERIKVLFEGEVKAFDNYMVTFDSKDLKPGFFFYTIRAGQEIYVGRLIMIK